MIWMTSSPKNFSEIAPISLDERLRFYYTIEAVRRDTPRDAGVAQQVERVLGKEKQGKNFSQKLNRKNERKSFMLLWLSR